MPISIIIPTLNEGKAISATLEGVRNVYGIEVIVSDGGSTDGTPEISASAARVVKSMPGRGIQMNTGASVASGDVLLFLHADTLLPENWAEKLLSAMSDERVVGGAFTLSIDSARLSHKIIASAANIRSRVTGIHYGDQGIFVKRSVFEKIGGYKDIPIMEDVDLMRRLKKVGTVVMLKDKVLTSARRWDKEGAVYATIRNWLLITLYYIGVAPERLYKFYKMIR